MTYTPKQKEAAEYTINHMLQTIGLTNTERMIQLHSKKYNELYKTVLKDVLLKGAREGRLFPEYPSANQFLL